MCGDETAYRLGRITLNPIKHVDIIGSIVVPLLCVILPGSLLFGWAKPVPVDTTRMRNPRKGLFISVLAGPASNIILAGVSTILFRAIPHIFPQDSQFMSNFYMEQGLGTILLVVVITNISLAIFNLIPVPPLDGSKILYSMLKPETQYKFTSFYEKYGLILTIAVIFYGGDYVAGAIVFVSRLILGL